MNILTELVDTARETIASGYYSSHGNIKPAPSLRRAIEDARAAGRTPIIAEVKPASPVRGTLIDGGIDGLIGQYASEGATGLSVLTEPKHFHGSLSYLRKGVATGLPVLMKDFILDERQVDCAAEIGAAAVLLIASILPRRRLDRLIEYAHLADREVVLEVASRKEYERAIETEADLVGINNRDLRTFEVDLARTRTIPDGLDRPKPVVSLSGYSTRAQIEENIPYADAFLVGSSLVDGGVTLKQLMEAP